jgi:23S rRNA pseudouridine2605 synthase
VDCLGDTRAAALSARIGGVIHLNRALSKLGILTRSQATAAVLAGRVSVDGRIVRDPAARVDPDRARIAVDGHQRRRVPWRTLLFHKPRGVVTTRRDPEGRPSVYDVIGEEANGLVPVGRLDLATSGLLVLTTDTQLAHWLTDPANGVPRLYVVTVRGRVGPEEVAALKRGVEDRGETLRATAARLRKASARESHLTVELREGKNREVRRLFRGVGHEVTRLKRVSVGGLELGSLAPGEWRAIDAAELHEAFPEGRWQKTRKV